MQGTLTSAFWEVVGVVCSHFLSVMEEKTLKETRACQSHAGASWEAWVGGSLGRQ